MITVKFTINGNPYKVDFREHDNMLETACYEPQLPHDMEMNGYVFELMTNGLYEGHAKPGDNYSMVMYRELQSKQLGLTWDSIWADNHHEDDDNIGSGDYFNCKLVKRLDVEILSTSDDDLTKIGGINVYSYGCDAASMVISHDGLRCYFQNNWGDGEYPIYYANQTGLIDRDTLNTEWTHVGLFELVESADSPCSAIVESYDCKFMGIELELTREGRYGVYTKKEGGTMLIEYWSK